ncbi:MAG: hypothetical protein KGI51_13590 [Rhodospirillales bacterium]|nr:hypothetical protein [Rhodospirillales bacterium]
MPPALAGSARWPARVGLVSYYRPGPRWRRTATGARFDGRGMTAAASWLPMGARVRVTLLATGRSAVVTIDDRMGRSKRLLDLSVAAARRLGMLHAGVARARVRRVK